ncbi:MAG: asparagine synthase (glutamine-hydrolyzing) [Algoriphagus sp.]|nr:asparagine synthase (glutamine-hydrolyzing) [Algoriphagus sp.]
MCGIAGIYRANGSVSDKETALMTTALNFQHHRGPDATGIFNSEKLVLGHNRLSIIDLSHEADQPLYREDLGLRIAFNGEIYNYKLLKKELEKSGYTFYTTSDTEVLLAGYHAFGSEICSKLVGMFAFAIWDEKKEELFLARDRFGEKPVFFIRENQNLFFASELNALRTLYNKPLQINHNAVIDLLEYLYINLHHTIYSEVSVFPPGNWLLIDENGVFSQKEYYKFPTKVKEPIDFQELKKATKEKLFQTVERELNADVPVASFLSSGVDSGLITAIAHEIKPDIRAVTMSTNEAATDETEGAAVLAKKLNIKHEIVPVNTDSLEVLAKILKDIQPLADASLIPSFLVTEQVRGRYTVMLSGDGGDEIFGSYNRPNLFLSLNQKGIPFGKDIVNFGLGVSDSFFGPRINSRLNDRSRLKIAGWEGYFSRHNLSGGLMKKVFTEGTEQNQPKKILLGLVNEYLDNPEKTTFGVDFKTRLPADFLFKVDSSAMHSSVEVRAPFLDHELVDFLLQVPTKSLMPNGIDKELSKALLSEFSGTDWHPPKRGFTIPYWTYLQNEWGDALETFLKEGISEEIFKFNKAGIIELLQTHRKKASVTIARILFGVLVLEIWLRVFHLNQKEIFMEKISIYK